MSSCYRKETMIDAALFWKGIENETPQRHERRRVALLSLLLPLCFVIFSQQSWSLDFQIKVVQEERNVTARNRSEATALFRLPEPTNHFSDFILDGKIPLDNRPRLKPLEMLKVYMSQHSEESLWQDYVNNNTAQRRFSVVHYSCPQQLGNRLHHFFNDFLLAYMTNRTILWKYWDREACIQLGNKYDHAICIDQNRSLSIDNTAAECDPILRTASWIPSFDEWSKRLDLGDPVQVWIRRINPQTAPHPPPDGIQRIQWQSQSGNGELLNEHELGVSPDWKLAIFQPLVGVLGPGFVKNQLTQNSQVLSKVQSLFILETEFWYGLLFDSAFRLRPEFLSSIQPSTPYSSSIGSHMVSTLSIALHSRHTDPLDAGSNVTNEITCLELMLQEVDKHNLTSCQVFMLSDRQQTLSAIRTWFDQNDINCTLVHAQHADRPTEIGLETEHGPYAGAGFMRDLELASQGASQTFDVALIGHSRSSSMLLREWVTYRRAIRLWKDHGVDPSRLRIPSICQLPG